MKRSVTIKLSQFAFEALTGGDRNGSLHVQATVEAAVHCYLGDRDTGRPAWPYPAAQREGAVREDVVLEAGIDDDLWRSLGEEADKQGVSVQKMFEHAALYFAAEVDAGQATQRILNDCDRGKEN